MHFAIQMTPLTRIQRKRTTLDNGNREKTTTAESSTRNTLVKSFCFAMNRWIRPSVRFARVIRSMKSISNRNLKNKKQQCYRHRPSHGRRTREISPSVRTFWFGAFKNHDRSFWTVVLVTVQNVLALRASRQSFENDVVADKAISKRRRIKNEFTCVLQHTVAESFSLPVSKSPESQTTRVRTNKKQRLFICRTRFTRHANRSL